MNSLPSPIDKYDHVYDGGEVRLLYFKNPPATGAYDIECPHCIVVTDGERPRMIVRFERDNHGCMLYSIMPNGDATYYSDVPSLNEAGFVSKVIELFETQKAETNKSEKSDAETKKGYDPIPFSPTLPDITKTEPIKAYLADPYGLYLAGRPTNRRYGFHQMIGMIICLDVSSRSKIRISRPTSYASLNPMVVTQIMGLLRGQI
jgi:hypothetical protein